MEGRTYNLMWADTCASPAITMMSRTPLSLNPRGLARLGGDNEYIYKKVRGIGAHRY